MHYRPEVDGLRAVAVLPVILFHAGFSIFSGGFVGVDVFFVISGYLITTIVYQEMAQDSFSMWRFYERRARRILPALFVVCLACIPFAWLWMMPSEFKNFSQSLIGVATFTSNILFWRESGYFADPAELKPLLHTWSLAVEEQFYILYPPLLLALYRFLPKYLFFIIGLGVLASLGLAQQASSSNPGANFYLLPSRAWELGVGALVALYLQHSRAPKLIDANQNTRRTQTLYELLGLLGLTMITYAVFVFDETTPFPSYWTLFPVLGTALIILTANSKTLIGRILSMRLLVGIGLLSYSAYLWHQPLFAFARIRLFEGVPIWGYWSLIALTLALAWLTRVAIEVPAHKRLKLSRQQVLSGAVIGCFVFGFVGGLGWASQGHTSRNAVPSELSAWKDSTSPYRGSCHNPDSPEDTCLIGDGDQTPIYVWGDSHGVELAWQLSERLRPKMIPVKPFTHSGCQPTIGVRRHGDTKCPEHNAAFFSYLTNEAAPSTVVLIARWSLNTDGTRFNNREGGVELGGDAAVFPNGWNGGSKEDRIEQVGQAISRTVAGLIQGGHRVILIYPIPEVGWNVPTYLARTALLKGEISPPLSTSNQVYQERSDTARANLNAIPANDSLLRIRPADLFCDSFIPGRCIAQLPDGRPLYFDDDHPNEIGARMIADDVLRSMRAEGWLSGQTFGP
ncbi:acyltransferase [Halomonas sp. SH5A2]|uniref:acyltransferase family protein n=1 Tax=Halomonas sp. SH5A2 TaxID=2749040 RepID=UPI00163FBD5E|nr:acyltransferase family protein [Halomonas sp. SH5A2]QNI02386.1 acyltransferase [Halomonas sp. SH5A2]